MFVLKKYVLVYYYFSLVYSARCNNPMDGGQSTREFIKGGGGCTRINIYFTQCLLNNLGWFFFGKACHFYIELPFLLSPFLHQCLKYMRMCLYNLFKFDLLYYKTVIRKVTA